MPTTTRPGDCLVERYRLDDLLSESGSGRFWRAVDQVLQRDVALHVMSPEDARAPGLLDAARRSAAVVDPRILRVLDAQLRPDTCFVVNEWGHGTSLDVALAAHGPLRPRVAAWLVGEVAMSLAAAHRLGVHHGRLVPENVLIDAGGAIRLIGFAVDAALHGLEAGTEAHDVTDLAGLLYAGLTGRWAGASPSSVSAAPTSGGRVLRPRQVRARVPRPLDDLVDALLNPTPETDPGLARADVIAEQLIEFVGDPDGIAAALAVDNPVRPPDPVVLTPVPDIALRHPPAPAATPPAARAASEPPAGRAASAASAVETPAPDPAPEPPAPWQGAAAGPPFIAATPGLPGLDPGAPDAETADETDDEKDDETADDVPHEPSGVPSEFDRVLLAEELADLPADSPEPELDERAEAAGVAELVDEQPETGGPDDPADTAPLRAARPDFWSWDETPAWAGVAPPPDAAARAREATRAARRGSPDPIGHRIDYFTSVYADPTDAADPTDPTDAAPELPQAELPLAELPQAELPQTELPQAELPQAELPRPHLVRAKLPPGFGDLDYLDDTEAFLRGDTAKRLPRVLADLPDRGGADIGELPPIPTDPRTGRRTSPGVGDDGEPAAVRLATSTTDLLRQRPTIAVTPTARPRPTRQWTLALAALVVLVLVVLALPHALEGREQPGLTGVPTSTSSTLDLPSIGPTPGTGSAPLLLPTATLQLDPAGHPGVVPTQAGETPLGASAVPAIDNDPATAWTTPVYDQQLVGPTAGAGLLLDLGSAQPVEEVDLELVGDPSYVQVFVTDAVPQALAVTQPTAAFTAGTAASVALPAGTSGRYVVVWLSKVPQVDTGYQGGITQVSLRG